MMDKPTLRELSPTQPAPWVPDHELLRCIGRGSYGEVWLARNTLGTYRAIKVVFRNNFEDARPFEREYTGIRKYEPISRSHPGLVDILQVGRNDAEGYFYYVMELADDASAECGVRSAEFVGNAAVSIPHSTFRTPHSYVPRTLSREKAGRGRIPARECITLGVSLSGALVELHRHGLIHRDIKPSNIIFVGGAAKLADIGLVTDAAEPLSYVGTEGFIPPEGPNSPQADIFSLGKVLYEIAMEKDRLDFPEPATALDEFPDRDELIELNSILLKACHPERGKRYSTAEQMHAELELLHQGRSIRAKRRSRQRLRWMAGAGVAVAFVTLAVLVVDRVLDWRTRALQGQSSLIHPSVRGKVAPRPPGLPGQLIDLSSAYTAPLTEKWYPGPPENTLASLPRGVQTLDGVQFDVRGLVQLAGHEINLQGGDHYPSRTRDLFVERWAQRLHFLHGAVFEVADGRVIGSYRIDYNTGRSVEVPIVYGATVRALWQPRSSSGAISNAVLAWRGQNPATESRDFELRLYHFAWENPWPAEQIVAVDFASAMANAAPFLIALTAEDALLSDDQKKLSLSLSISLQEAARSFQQVTVRTEVPLPWSPLRLYERPVEIGGRFYDGFRFTMPADGSPDFAWAFGGQRRSLQGWFILPMTGALKVGFEDWYHALPQKQAEGGKLKDFVVQFLSGRKLEPGREYIIWFGSDTNNPVELQTVLRFLPPESVDSNQPAELVKSLGVPLSTNATFHRHYCLGAIR